MVEQSRLDELQVIYIENGKKVHKLSTLKKVLKDFRGWYQGINIRQ